MSNPHAFKSMNSNELRAELLRAARRDRAPDGARERALLRVASLPLGVAVPRSAHAVRAAPIAPKSVAIVVVKWVAIGLSASLLGLGAVEQLQRSLAKPPRLGSAATALVTGTTHPVSTSQASAVELAKVVAEVPTVQPSGQTPRLRVAATPGLDAAHDSGSTTPESPPVSPLPREVAALRRARAALASGRPEIARGLLIAYRREFATGMLDTEAAALEVEVAFASQSRAAVELAEAFLREHATSPLTRRVRGLIEASRVRSAKP